MEAPAIATTSAELAATVLDCLTASGQDLAILHGEAAVAGGDCSSDVDLVTGDSARQVVARAHERLRHHDLHPVVLWPYDVGSASLFVVDARGRHGAQFDILHDRSGRGHYGVRATEILAHARPGVRWRRAAPDDELLYLIRKRLYKGEHDRLAQLLATTTDTSVGRLGRRADRLFAGPSAAAVRAALGGRRQPADPLRRVRETVVNGGRIVARLRRPVGFWVAVDGDAARSAAELLARRFGRVLPASAHGPTTDKLTTLARCAPRIAAVRWRAGLYASWGPVAAPVRPDLMAHAADGAHEDLVAQVVIAMERRLRR